MIFSHCTLKFDHHTVFDNFHFELKENQWTCLLGQSGIGKSSLLKIIAGLLNPTHIDAYEPLSISYLPQQDGLMPWLSVWDNLFIGYTLRGEKIHRPLIEKAKHLLHRIGLKHTHSLRPDALSGGMRQRIALIRTLLEDKPMVLMDEPFSSLDINTRLELHELTAELLQNKTILLVTHDPLDAIRLGDTVHIMKGTPATIQESFNFHETLDLPKPRDLQLPMVSQQYMHLLNTLCQKP